MPWYIWLLFVIVLGTIASSLWMIKKNAKRIPLTEEQKQRIAQRNAELDAQEEQDRR